MTLSILVASVSVFVLSSVWYMALSPVEARFLGAAAPQRGGRPGPAKAGLELLRSAIVAGVIVGLARRSHVDGVGAVVLLGLVLWAGFPLVLLTGSVIWERVSPITAALHAGDWLLKLVVISIIVGFWL